MNTNDLAHEIWAVAQLAPKEGIEDGVARVAALLDAAHAIEAGAAPLTDDVSVEAYRIGGLKVERARQMKSDDLWAVRDELKNVLNISGGA